MRLKSFHAKTMNEAMAQVRAALGDDAIIVATRDEGPSRGVRVTAAIEDLEEPPISSFDTPAPGAYHAAASVAKGPRFASNEGAAPDAMRHASENDIGEQITTALLEHGVPAILAQRLSDVSVQRVVGMNAQAALTQALESAFMFKPLSMGNVVRPLMFVGNYGGGKTASLAKHATRLVLSGVKPVVISCDHERAGGNDQLAALMRVLGIDVILADSPAALAREIANAKNTPQILIDTAAHNPFSTSDMAQLAILVRSSEMIEPIMVMPAGQDARDAAECAEIFAAIGCRRMIISRFDAVRRCGGVLSAAARADLALAEAGDSPSVANGLQPLCAEWLANRFLPPALRPVMIHSPAPSPSVSSGRK